MTQAPDRERYARQELFEGIGTVGQARLRAARVLIVGCGALGSHIASTMVRAGVASLTIVDRDFLELSNLQRQVLFDEEDLARGLPKAVAAAEKCRRINSDVAVEPRVIEFHAGNAEALIGASDVVMDGTDNFQTRYLVNDACVKLGKPWVYGGVVAAYGMSMAILPGDSPCFRCVFSEPPAAGSTATADTVGIVEPAVAIVAAFECVEALKILTGARDRVRRGLVHIDLWENRLLSMGVGSRDPECPACGQGRYDYLRAEGAGRTSGLFGRNAVQVMPDRPMRLDLTSLAERLRAEGKLMVNAWLLRLEVGAHVLTVFPDGRTIVKGTSDEAVARALHDRYVGS